MSLKEKWWCAHSEPNISPRAVLYVLRINTSLSYQDNLSFVNCFHKQSLRVRLPGLLLNVMKCKFNERHIDRMQAVVPATNTPITQVNAFQILLSISQQVLGRIKIKKNVGVINLTWVLLNILVNVSICESAPTEAQTRPLSYFFWNLNENLILLSSERPSRMSVPFFKRYSPHFRMKRRVMRSAALASRQQNEVLSGETVELVGISF